MVDTFAKEIDCVLCSEVYSPVVEPEEDHSGYNVHCSSCVRWLHIAKSDPVRVTLRDVLDIRGEALALAVQNYLAPCPCGQPFDHAAGNRCLSCIEKIKKETKKDSTLPPGFICIWDIPKLKEIEGKVFSFIFERLEGEAETLTQIIERFEAGELDPGAYMEKIENIQYREAIELAVIKAWAMMVGPEMVFSAAEEHGLVEHYGARILITLATGLEMGYGTSILTTLTREEKNLDGMAQKEIRTFIKKIAGGF